MSHAQVLGVYLSLENANAEAREHFSVHVIGDGVMPADEDEAGKYAEYGDDGCVKYTNTNGVSEPAVVYVEEHPLTDAYEDEEEDEEEGEERPGGAAAYPPPEDEEEDDFADEEDVDEFEEAPVPGAKRKKM